MSRSLSIIRFREDEPASCDPLERKTWAGLRIEVAGDCVTEFHNRKTSEPGNTIYVPTFPLARWFVSNWWALFYEPARRNPPPEEKHCVAGDPATLDWLHRHCLRTSESSLFLPYLSIFGNGDGVTITNVADAPDLSARMPGYFTRSIFKQLDRSDVMAELKEFIAEVLSWCSDVRDERLDMLRDDWSAICSASDEEGLFCRAAGRLGLDPYAVETWEEGIESLLDTLPDDVLASPMMTDLLEGANPAALSAYWKWVSAAGWQRLSYKGPDHGLGLQFGSATDQGYHWAKQMRQATACNDESPIEDLVNALANAIGRQFHFDPHNHLPKGGVQALTGWKNPHEAVIVGPVPSNASSRRFLQARGIYLALAGCDAGPRLLTQAHTWAQQASRAFAAEFLAPASALIQKADSEMEFEEREVLKRDLAARYQVSSEVVHWQLVNQGIWRDNV